MPSAWRAWARAWDSSRRCSEGRSAAGVAVTRPDLAPFRALMEPAYKRIGAYAGEDNVAKFRAMVEEARKA